MLFRSIKLLLPQHDDGKEIEPADNLFGAIKTIVIADAVMSLDNVIGIAGAAKDHLGLVVFGLLISIPIIVWGSRFVLTLMDRFPVVIVCGAALLGWIGGGMMVEDVWLKPQLADLAASVGPAFHYLAAAIGAALVVVIGKVLGRAPAPESAPEHAPTPTSDGTSNIKPPAD